LRNPLLLLRTAPPKPLATRKDPHLASPRFRLSCAVEGCDGRVKYNIDGVRYH
jgi:hypothetical protein